MAPRSQSPVSVDGSARSKHPTSMHAKHAHLRGSLKCALRSVHKEVLGFHFNYPLQVVSEAGPRESLHYYLYSDSLSWEAMRLDSDGIPRAWSRTTGTVYWASYIAWYGLVQLGHYLRYGDATNLAAFLKQVDWLERHAVLRDDDAVVWFMNFDYPEGSFVLRAPWISAHVQGLAISALVRGWRITRRPQLLELLKKSARVFALDVDDHGIRVRVDHHIFYTEVPGGPSPGILDGFLTSLLGLYDLAAETGDIGVWHLFDQGIQGLKHLLPAWDYRQKWSWYGRRAYLCPPAYHCLNRVLLSVLARLADDPGLAECARSWDPQNLSPLGRAEVFLGFLLTKNASRIKHRTWRFRTVA
jgi:D-glucuronyl C5-epimerase C-terminus